MITCKNCGTEYADDVKFCGNCGAKLSKEEPQKPKPEPESSFVKQSNEPVPEKPDISNEPQKQTFSEQRQAVQSKIVNALKNPTKKTNKTVFSIAAVVLALIIVAVAVLPSVFNKSSSKLPEAVIYIKDGELNYTSLKTIAPVEITEALRGATSFGTGSSSVSLSNSITLSKDGSRLFYPDKVDSGSNGFSLYYKDLKKLNSNTEAIKIDSDIIYYRINDTASKVFYIKGGDSNFYENDLKSKDKIDSSVTTFYLDKSAQRIIYVKQDGMIYYKENGKDKQKIDSESNICYVSEDLKLIYYIKDGSLYKYDVAGGSEKTKIDTEVAELINVYKSGELYYKKNKAGSVKFMDYVEDDMKSNDEQMSEPVQPEIPRYSDYDTFEDYSKASDEYDDKYAQYLEDKQAYSAKEERDEMRQSLSEKEYLSNMSALYYFDGKTATALNESVSFIETYNYNNPVCVFKSKNKKEMPKLKLSTISSVLMVEEYISTTFGGDELHFAAVKGKVSELDSKEISSITTNYSGNKIYYIDDINEEKGYGTLNEISINDGNIGFVQKYDDEVSSLQFLYKSDTFVYYKNIEKEHGDLMMNKKKIDSDVSRYGVLQLTETEKFLYAVDYDSSKGVGTLKLYDGNKNIKIADDVKSFYAVNDKCITYMQNYDSLRDKGDLYLYDGSDKRKPIDTDITDIVYFYWDSTVLS